MRKHASGWKLSRPEQEPEENEFIFIYNSFGVVFKCGSLRLNKFVTENKLGRDSWVRVGSLLHVLCQLVKVTNANCAKS